MDNSLQAHLPILVQVVIGAALPVLTLVASHVFGQRVHKKNRTPARDAPYECGIQDSAATTPHPRFAVKFYVTAMLFILFDIEVVFLIPWALSFRELAAHSIAVALPSAAFIGLLAFGLLYELKKGALEWDKPELHRSPSCK
ncbi:MAG: NADH-quinone oxidoreductase subunit A [Puniceicoccales bacterium]|jgi:NADH-quinone oxidoreductase subunit A|nr:NADH-quinone oxidoreductase subunit A [Puniceicoccales bacterium]